MAATTTGLGAGGITAVGQWGATQDEEEEPIEDTIARTKKEVAEEAVRPYGSPKPIGIPPGNSFSSDSWASTKSSHPPSNHDTILPYSRYPHSPLPSESTPIGPHDPATADPSTIQGLPPHHIPRPHLTEGTADTHDTTTLLAALTTVSPDPQLTARDLILALGLSVSLRPLP
ncbi:unnamed protein product [Closterium sp. NIES-54]